MTILGVMAGKAMGDISSRGGLWGMIRAAPLW